MEQLREDEFERYARQIVLEEIGLTGQIRLRQAKVCLVGLGGLGCPTALKLAGLGVGYIRIVDRDVVSRTDLHRQYLYNVEDVGLPKVEAAADKLSKLNPDVKIEPLALALTPSTSHKIIEGCDLVIDGLDSLSPRYILNRACIEQKIPYIFGAAIELRGNLSTIIPHQTACLECFYPGIDDRTLDRCAVVGVHPSIIGIVSSMQVFEATRLLTGKEPLLSNRLLYADLSTLSFDTINLRREENCSACGRNPRSIAQPKEDLLVEESCSRDGRATYMITLMKPVELEIPALIKIVEGKGYPVKTKSRLSVAFDYDPRIRVSILKSGNGVAQVKPPRFETDREQVLTAYQSILKEFHRTI